MTEWLKVMLEEIARKRADAEQALDEEKRRETAPNSPDPQRGRPGPS